VRQLQNDMASLVDDLVVTDTFTGLPKGFRQDNLQLLKNLFRTILFEQLQCIPVPRLSGEDENSEWVFENIILKGAQILPEKMMIKMKQQAELRPKEAFRASQTVSTLSEIPKAVPEPPQALGRATFSVMAEGIDVNMRDVKFWFKRKSFPKMEDHGVSSVRISNCRIKFKTRVESSTLDNAPVCFILETVDCDISKVNIHIDEAKHDFLLNVYTSLWSSSIKKRIENRIEHALIYALNAINTVLTSTIQTVTKTIASASDKLTDTAGQMAHKASELPKKASEMYHQ